MPYRITIDEVDTSTGDAFRAQVDQAVAAAVEERGVATLDFADVVYFGSTGTAVLAQASHRLPVGGRLRIINVSDHVRRVLEVTGLNEHVEVS